MRMLVVLLLYFSVGLSIKVRCLYKIEKGNCDGQHMRYAFDRNTKTCVTFTFSGCGGNANRYPTIQRCRRTCLKGSLDFL